MNQMLSKETFGLWEDRLLTMLERLLELPTNDVNSTLNQATQLVAEVLAAEKVEAFLHDAATDALVALDISDTPMGRRQHSIGMDRLLLVNGGRLVEVFLTGLPYLTGHADQDSEELVGMKVGLGVKSEITTIFEVEKEHRGMSPFQIISCSMLEVQGLSNGLLEAVAVTKEKRKVICSRTNRNNRSVEIRNRQPNSQNRKASRMPLPVRLR